MKNSWAIPRKPHRTRIIVLTSFRYVFACLLVVSAAFASCAFSQEISSKKLDEPSIRGIVLDSYGKPVAGATVHLKRADTPKLEVRVTNEAGVFTFTAPKIAGYSLTAEKSAKHSNIATFAHAPTQVEPRIELVLNQNGPSREFSFEAMQFVDQPNFTVAGVTDFTAAGGHGSDSSLRTSEALARETSTLKSGNSLSDSQASHTSDNSEDRLKTALVKSPNSFAANHDLGEYYLQSEKFAHAVPLLQSAYRIDKENRENEYDLALACKGMGDLAHSRKYVQELLTRQENADLYRLAGDLDESLGDSLAAVREYQKAVSLDPSEKNLFSWASELLLHRAIWQAQQIFEQGAKQYPVSARMLTGLGAALFAGAAYTEAATTLCQASDLNPLDQEPYIFLGKIQMAAPNRLACIEQRLQRFLQQQPASAPANYLYAMALQKRHDNPADVEILPQPETLLRNAIAIDPKYADAYLQLGIISASRKNFEQAIDSYTKAIAANPQLSDAYYRLAVAYDRTGQSVRAQEEFKLHDEVAKKQAVEVERQRQEVKQFLVVLSPDASH